MGLCSLSAGSGPVFYLWPNNASANEGRRYICNVISHWLRLCSAKERKRDQILRSRGSHMIYQTDTMVGLLFLVDSHSNLRLAFETPLTFNDFNSLRPGASVKWAIHHLFRIWIVACAAPGHYINHCLLDVNLTSRRKVPRSLNPSNKHLQNAILKVVCKMSVILFRPQCVKGTWRILTVNKAARRLIEIRQKASYGDHIDKVD